MSDQSTVAIREMRERFNKAIVEHDAESIGALLAPNYHIVTGRSDQFHGAEEEARRWSDVFAKDATVIYTRTPREIQVNEAWGLAEELGNWTGSYCVENEAVHASGVYAAKWQRTERGAWRIQVEVFTTLVCSGSTRGCVRPDPII